MLSDVLPDSLGGCPDDTVGHEFWLCFPRLICHVVHVAIVAVEIAVAVNFEEKGAKAGIIRYTKSFAVYVVSANLAHR